jgi:transcriptional regulator with XRE-family HTH domain
MDLKKPSPHPAKAVIKANNISVASVARFMGLSFTYVTNILNGVMRITPENENKLKEIIEHLGGDKNESDNQEKTSVG